MRDLCTPSTRDIPSASLPAADALVLHLLAAPEAADEPARAALWAPPRPGADLEIAIPAFNEASRLPLTLRRTIDYLRVQPWSSRIVVVDNGSCDETAEVVREVALATDRDVPVDLIGCARPGKGAAVRRALLSSRSRFVGFFDADLATPLETLSVAMTHLERGAAVVIGSRHAEGSSFVHAQPPGRRIGGAAFRLMTRRMVSGVHDTQCGFKFFQRQVVTQALATCRSTGFAFDVELLCHLQRDGHEIIELPVAWTDGAGSTFRPLRDGWASFGAVRQMHRATTGRPS